MHPIYFPQVNVTLAKDQPQYLPLPIYRDQDVQTQPEGKCVSCWQLTWGERFKLLFSGKLWLSQLTFYHALQPQRPSVMSPWEEQERADHEAAMELSRRDGMA